jgi:hypothetical protein
VSGASPSEEGGSIQTLGVEPVAPEFVEAAGGLGDRPDSRIAFRFFPRRPRQRERLEARRRFVAKIVAHAHRGSHPACPRFVRPRVQETEIVVVGAGKRDELSRLCIETPRKFPEPQAGSSTRTDAICSAKRLRRRLRSLFILVAGPPLAVTLISTSFTASSLTTPHLPRSGAARTGSTTASMSSRLV